MVPNVIMFLNTSMNVFSLKRPPGPRAEDGPGEAAKMSGQWIVVAVTFCMLFWGVIGLAQGGRTVLRSFEVGGGFSLELGVTPFSGKG